MAAGQLLKPACLGLKFFFQACWVNFLDVLDRQDASYGPVDRPTAEYTPSQGLICAEKNYP